MASSKEGTYAKTASSISANTTKAGVSAPCFNIARCDDYFYCRGTVIAYHGIVSDARFMAMMYLENWKNGFSLFHSLFYICGLFLVIWLAQLFSKKKRQRWLLRNIELLFIGLFAFRLVTIGAILLPDSAFATITPKADDLLFHNDGIRLQQAEDKISYKHADYKKVDAIAQSINHHPLIYHTIILDTDKNIVDRYAYVKYIGQFVEATPQERLDLVKLSYKSENRMEKFLEQYQSLDYLVIHKFGGFTSHSKMDFSTCNFVDWNQARPKKKYKAADLLQFQKEMDQQYPKVRIPLDFRPAEMSAGFYHWRDYEKCIALHFSGADIYDNY